MSAIQEYLDSLQEKTITVIGMGVSNTPLIRMLLRAGLKVTVRDKAPRERFDFPHAWPEPQYAPGKGGSGAGK